MGRLLFCFVFIFMFFIFASILIQAAETNQTQNETGKKISSIDNNLTSQNETVVIEPENKSEDIEVINLNDTKKEEKRGVIEKLKQGKRYVNYLIIAAVILAILLILFWVFKKIIFIILVGLIVLILLLLFFV